MIVSVSIGVFMIIGNGESTQPDKHRGYVNDSIKGTFAVANVGIGSKVPESGVGIVIFDGKGNLTGVNVQNLPGPTFTTRRLVETNLKGKYIVEENGSGSGTITNTLSDGSTRENNFDFMVTEVVERVERLDFPIAQEVSFIIRELSDPTGNLVTSVATRLPNEGKFSLASLNGTFAFYGFGPGDQDPAAGFGQITFDGKGNFSGFDVLNVPKEEPGSFGERQFFSRDFEGTYAVDKNGIFTGFLDTGDQARFVISNAKVVGDIKIAEEYFYIVPSQHIGTTGGFLITSFGRKLPDKMDVEFTNASIEGDFAFTGIGRGGNTANASAGVIHFNGKGVITGIENLNQPGTSFRERRYDVFPIKGTYEVEPRGTGIIREGDTGEVHLRILITQSIVNKDGKKIAQEITFLPLNLIEETGNLVVSVATKLPNQGKFTQASLYGTYAFSGRGRDGQAPEAGIGMIRFDGKGNASAFDILNLPGQPFGERVVARFPFEATYVVEDNGLGTVTPKQGGGEALFVIKKAKVVKGVKVATEIGLIINGLSDAGNLVTDIIKKISE
jgi:hypothetical protein